jgi:hypothetical protein
MQGKGSSAAVLSRPGSFLHKTRSALWRASARSDQSGTGAADGLYRAGKSGKLVHPESPRLVTWYERAITHYLQEQLDDLTMFTPEEVTRMFVPPSRIGPTQHKKLTAAAQALEHLAHRGQLMCQIIGGERQYVNILDRYLSK